MKALWLVKRGTWEVRDAPTPGSKAGEVRIAVRTSGLNFHCTSIVGALMRKP